MTPEAIAASLSAYIVTRGAQGSTIYAGGVRHDIPPVAAEQVIPPCEVVDVPREPIHPVHRAGGIGGGLRRAHAARSRRT